MKDYAIFVLLLIGVCAPFVGMIVMAVQAKKSAKKIVKNLEEMNNNHEQS